MCEQNLALNNLKWFICHKTHSNPTKSYIIDTQYLALNNLQWLICHKIRPKQIIYIWFGLVSLFFNGKSTLFRLFNAKAIHQEEQ